MSKRNPTKSERNKEFSFGKKKLTRKSAKRGRLRGRKKVVWMKINKKIKKKVKISFFI